MDVNRVCVELDSEDFGPGRVKRGELPAPVADSSCGEAAGNRRDTDSVANDADRENGCWSFGFDLADDGTDGTEDESFGSSICGVVRRGADSGRLAGLNGFIFGATDTEDTVDAVTSPKLSPDERRGGRSAVESNWTANTLRKPLSEDEIPIA